MVYSEPVNTIGSDGKGAVRVSEEAKHDAILRWERKLRATRAALSADLDVWAAVEICWKHCGNYAMPLRADATGVNEIAQELVDEIITQMQILRVLGTVKIKKTRPTDWDSKYRSAIVDLLFKLLVKGERKYGSIPSRVKKSLQDLYDCRGETPQELETWSEVQGALNEFGDLETKFSVLKIRPLRGRWSGLGQRDGMHAYRILSRHRKIVSRFLDCWALSLVGQCPYKNDKEINGLD